MFVRHAFVRGLHFESIRTRFANRGHPRCRKRLLSHSLRLSSFRVPTSSL